MGLNCRDRDGQTTLTDYAKGSYDLSPMGRDTLHTESQQRGPDSPVRTAPVRTRLCRSPRVRTLGSEPLRSGLLVRTGPDTFREQVPDQERDGSELPGPGLRRDTRISPTLTDDRKSSYDELPMGRDTSHARVPARSGLRFGRQQVRTRPVRTLLIEGTRDRDRTTGDGT